MRLAGSSTVAVDELRWIAVGVDEAGSHVFCGKTLQLEEDVLDRIAIELAVLVVLHDRVQIEHLEEVELDIPDVALVVTHVCSRSARPLSPGATALPPRPTAERQQRDAHF